ncbi:MAG: diguanylate cyclase [Helicobacteraceae bacterium]|nr:diguanylate cyclase [Candidatus Sulfurimonas ponti]MBL6973240.1 diguanylate cyclase [Sulfurimonas sp.]
MKLLFTQDNRSASTKRSTTNMRNQSHHDFRELSRIVLPALVAITLFIFSSFFLFIPKLEKGLLEQKKIMIKELVNSSYNMIHFMDREVSSGAYSLKDAQKIAIDHLREMKYGVDGKDYFWINDFSPLLVMHPYRPDLEGQNMSDFVDPAGTKVFMEFVKAVSKTGEGYVSYMWQWEDDKNKIIPKLSFVKEYKPWGWIIGTGVYLEDVKKEVALISRNLIVISVIILILVFLIAWYQIHQALNVLRMRQLAETKLLEYKDQLETKVKDRTAELSKANGELIHEVEHRQEVEEKLKILVTTDELTNTYNRRAFNNHMYTNMSRAKRYNEPLSVLMLDIDYFKNVNDSHGHDVGDLVLKSLAYAVKGSIRQEDIFARWGGEEFTVLLPQTGKDTALQLAERLRQTVAEHHFPKSLHITVSIGCTTFQNDDSFESFVKRADTALYQAKDSGRNIVEYN